jgi:hypothetical protein
MSIKKRPPAVEPWIKIPRDLLSSDAWRSLGINGRRVIDFLMCEHMGKAGRGNGKLKAPYRQLEDFGINARFAGDAIREAENLGLVDCNRAGLRAASTYTLTWLPSHDGTPASDYWRAYRNPSLQPLSSPKGKNLPYKGKAGLPYKGKADKANLPYKGKAERAETLPYKGKALLRKILPGRTVYLGRGECDSAPAPGPVSAEPAAPSPGKLRLVGSGGHE